MFTIGATYNLQKIGECVYKGEALRHGAGWCTFVDSHGGLHYLARHHVVLIDRPLNAAERATLKGDNIVEVDADIYGDLLAIATAIAICHRRDSLLHKAASDVIKRVNDDEAARQQLRAKKTV